jgi:hypothetical protein
LAVLVDTGKVTSSNKSASPLIPVTAKDIQLQWTLQLWDSDNAPGPLSTPQLFTVTDSPVPVINTPTANQILTAANPSISWNTGIASTKVQHSIASTSVRWSDCVRLWYCQLVEYFAPDSDGIPGEQRYLHSQCLCQGQLQPDGDCDTELLDELDATIVSIAVQCFLPTYSRFGYVHLVLDPTGFDADFFAWNIYRRKYGETAWTLIGSLTKTSDLVTFRDYGAASGTKYQYAMTQVADRFRRLRRVEYCFV